MRLAPHRATSGCQRQRAGEAHVSACTRVLLVEVLGRYSNLSDQGELLRHLLTIVPEASREVTVRTPKQVQHRLPALEVERLRLSYESGATLEELARNFRIHRGTAADILERSGVARRGKGPSEQDIRRAIRMYESGQSTATIGQRLGFAADTIRNGLIKAGVEMRGPHDWRR
jgi:hypothetical protein